uniref:Uncharacterized protein n=1 Tax=viral metagenome TaxID=1070528 RepID=A0A6C0IFK5_9ZZZZ
MASTEESKILIDTAIYLNNQIKLGEANNNIFTRQMTQNSDSMKKNQVVLQDIKDAIETKNREFLERQTEMSTKGIKKDLTVQDWSLTIVYFGYGLFSLLLLIYIFKNVENAFMYGTLYLILTFILYTCLMFVIQRYG